MVICYQELVNQEKAEPKYNWADKAAIYLHQIICKPETIDTSATLEAKLPAKKGKVKLRAYNFPDTTGMDHQLMNL